PHPPTRFFRSNMLNRKLSLSIGCVLMAFVARSLTFAQQSYVGRYDVYAGFTDFNTPALGLNQIGAHTQGGVVLRRWLSLGVDYSVVQGSEVLKPDLLPAALQQEIAPVITQLVTAGVIPPGYRLIVPANVSTQSFAAGPQFAYRHFSKTTLYLRPSFGAFRLAATPRPKDPIAALITKTLIPAGYKVDWTGFYGLGGGAELKFTRHIGILPQIDLVYNHPFNDILAHGNWTMRYSIGPIFHFGKNVGSPVNHP
ncbi:MAG TPA: hypothetical protein VFN53_03280, partial [Acidobacteriaceae bacterium]|nr:hypothetical protein [Acidobacteriaceae bacterium]